MIKQKQMFTVPRRLRASFRAVVHTAGSALSVLGSAPPEVATSLDTRDQNVPHLARHGHTLSPSDSPARLEGSWWELPRCGGSGSFPAWDGMSR